MFNTVMCDNLDTCANVAVAEMLLMSILEVGKYNTQIQSALSDSSKTMVTATWPHSPGVLEVSDTSSLPGLKNNVINVYVLSTTFIIVMS